MPTPLRIACVAAALATLCPADPASAQAFTQAKGEGRVIASLLYSNSDRGFDDGADTIDIADYKKTEVYLLAEYGLTDDVTLLLTPSWRDVSVDGGRDTRGIGFTDVGARIRMAKSERFTFSLQGLVRIPGRDRFDRLAQVSQTNTEFDMRAQGGATFGAGHFAILEGGYRLRAGAPPNDVHIDATLGLRAAPRLLFLASSYNTISDGRGRGVFTRYRYNNVFLSGAYDVSPRITLQLGVSGTVAGRNALRERGLFSGLWFRF